MQVLTVRPSDQIRCVWMTDVGQRVFQNLPAGKYTLGVPVPMEFYGKTVDFYPVEHLKEKRGFYISKHFVDMLITKGN